MLCSGSVQALLRLYYDVKKLLYGGGMTGRSDASAVTSDSSEVAEQLLKDVSDELLTLEDLDADYDPEAYYYFTTTTTSLPVGTVQALLRLCSGPVQLC